MKNPVFVAAMGVALVLPFGAAYWASLGHQTQNCSANLRLLGLATMQYARDYDENYLLTRNWRDALEPYHRRELVMDCPHSEMNYAMNRYFSGLKWTTEEIAEAPLFFDSTSTARNAADRGESWPQDAAHTRFGDWKIQRGWHMVVGDASVKFVTRKPRFAPLGPTFPPLSSRLESPRQSAP